MRRLFVEFYSYHFETFYPLLSEFGKNTDVVMFDKNLPGSEILSDLPHAKMTLSLTQILSLAIRNEISEIYLNTLSINLYARSIKVWVKNIKILLLVLVKIIKPSIKLRGTMHEADLFVPVTVMSPTRHRIFCKLIGRYWIKLFDQVFVLAPEVQRYLQQFDFKADFLSTKALRKLEKPNKKNNESVNTRQYIWIGPMDAGRRNWQPLMKIEKDYATNFLIDLVCDIRAKDGPRFIAEIKDKNLEACFKTRNYRPTDSELYERVEASDCVLCFYSHPGYGRYKTSGARHTAIAFQKPTIAFNSLFEVLDKDGNCIFETTDINEVLNFELSPSETN